jgi:type 1 glutamine amidotransferase
MTKKIMRYVAAAGFVLMRMMAVAEPVQPAAIDCPLAREPYSSNTVLIDLLLDPRSKEVLQKLMPSVARFSAKPPTFAAIITPRHLPEMFSVTTDKLDELDRALADIPVTEEAAAQRCARYDHTPPELPDTKAHPAILVFEKITGFLDAPSVNAARAALRELASKNGWSLIFTDNGAVFNPAQLKKFDAVIWNNISGDALTISQQDAFKTYLEQGGGYAGIHGSGGDSFYVWDWYATSLLGAKFIGHPMWPQFQSAVVKVETPKTGITSELPDQWTMTEEWYSFASNPRTTGAHILATIDEATYDPRQLSMGGDHPIAWTRCIRDGRAFYTAIGHRPESYMESNSAKLLEQGIAWAAGMGKTHCKNGNESKIRR